MAEVVTTPAAMNGGASVKGPVVVTGASGFVGSWLVMKLLQAGYTVRATVRDPGELHYCLAVLRRRSRAGGGTVRAVHPIPSISVAAAKNFDSLRVVVFVLQRTL